MNGFAREWHARKGSLYPDRDPDWDQTPAEQVADQLAVTDAVEPTTPQAVHELLARRAAKLTGAGLAAPAAVEDPLIREYLAQIKGADAEDYGTVQDLVAAQAIAAQYEAMRVERDRLATELDDARRMWRYHQNQRSKDARWLEGWRNVARDYEAAVTGCQTELRAVRAERDRLAAQVRQVQSVKERHGAGEIGARTAMGQIEVALDGGVA
jgi:hypothetical protein